MLELHVGFLFQGHLLFLFFQRACQYPISSTADGAECYRQTRAFFFFPCWGNRAAPRWSFWFLFAVFIRFPFTLQNNVGEWSLHELVRFETLKQLLNESLQKKQSHLFLWHCLFMSQWCHNTTCLRCFICHRHIFTSNLSNAAAWSVALIYEMSIVRNTEIVSHCLTNNQDLNQWPFAPEHGH